jgi:hypothetical protein
MWHPITREANLPSDRDLRLAVIDRDEVHALVFPCRHRNDGWIDARTGRVVDLVPTHWQDWSDDPERAPVRH